jgi:thiamine biosynthesis lipoprotein
MSEPGIHVFKHHAMATFFEVRIAGQERPYAAQAAQAAFMIVDRQEALLSRFRENSEISAIANLKPGETLRLAESVFSCLEIARAMETATGSAFSIASGALHTQNVAPRWTLLRDKLAIRCDIGKLDFDLGAIGKGFALDRMAVELADWDCPSYLLNAGGSSILAGEAPPGRQGWSAGLGEDNATRRFWLTHCSLSGSGLAVKGEHILDPRSGAPARIRSKAWALASTAAQSDALSTACMVLSETEIIQRFNDSAEWLVFFLQDGQWRHCGKREMPMIDCESGDCV